MNGVIVSVLAKPDDAVAKGQCVVVLEAMKMQHEIVAERGGIIDNVFVKPGDQVATRALLAELRPDEPASAWQQEAAS
jgi:geranyl-CoA carboxylase alpha subunit